MSTVASKTKPTPPAVEAQAPAPPPRPRRLEDFPAVAAARQQYAALERQRRGLESTFQNALATPTRTNRDKAEDLLAGKPPVEDVSRAEESRRQQARHAVLLEALALQREVVAQAEDAARRQLRDDVDKILRLRVKRVAQAIVAAVQAQASLDDLIDRLEDANGELGLNWNVCRSPISQWGKLSEASGVLFYYFRDLAEFDIDLSDLDFPPGMLLDIYASANGGRRQPPPTPAPESLLAKVKGFVWGDK